MIFIHKTTMITNYSGCFCSVLPCFTQEERVYLGFQFDRTQSVYLRKPEVCLRKPEVRRKRQVIPSVSTLRKQRANSKFGKVKQSQWPTSSNETLPLDGYRFFPNSTISWIPRIQTDVPALWNISQSSSNTGCLHVRGSFYC